MLPFFEWCQTTSVSVWMNSGVWQFAVIEALHLLGLCLLGGALLVVDLRMLGVGLTKQPISVLERQARRWLIAALLLMVATGLLLFLTEPIRCYYNRSFWVKMTTLPLALAFTFTVRARVAQRADDASGWARPVGVASMLLWFTVAAAGRWIGFS